MYLKNASMIVGSCVNLSAFSRLSVGLNQSWALNTFLYLNTKYTLKMYLNTKYFLQMYLNTFVNTFLYYFQNIVLIHSFHYKFEDVRN